MPLRAGLFDVGGTLVDRWIPRDDIRAALRAWAERDLGPVPWLRDLVDADVDGTIGVGGAEPFSQETAVRLAEWLAARGVVADPAEVERVRRALCPPLEALGALAPGAKAALRWCRENGMRVILVTNTLTRGDAEIAEDARRYGIDGEVDGLITSHSCGWLKPHPEIFRRALALAGVAAADAVMVGDRLDTDIAGAKRLGMRALLKVAGERDPRRDPAEGVGSDVAPDGTFAAFDELPGILSAW